MTKEELEIEAIAKYKTGSYPQLHPDHFAFIHGYLASAEPREKRIEELTKWLSEASDEKLKLQMLRVDLVSKIGKQEKQIQIDAEQIIALQKQNGELTDKCNELEAQIEKMKCCENCAWWYKLPNGQRDCAETCENLDNWSLRR